MALRKDFQADRPKKRHLPLHLLRYPRRKQKVKIQADTPFRGVSALLMRSAPRLPSRLCTKKKSRALYSFNGKSSENKAFPLTKTLFPFFLKKLLHSPYFYDIIPMLYSMHHAEVFRLWRIYPHPTFDKRAWSRCDSVTLEGKQFSIVF